MKWFVAFTAIILFCVMCIRILVLTQRMPNNVVSFEFRHMKAQTVKSASTKQVTTKTHLGLSKKNSISASTALKNKPMDVSAVLPPLLTLFTSLKNASDRFEIHSNMLRNWAIFKPYVIPLLYTFNSDPKLVELARKLGWAVMPVPETNSFGTPYFKPMYRQAKSKYASVFYGFANADLLFEDGLVDTLKVVNSCLNQLNQTLIVGQRTNFKVKNRTVFEPNDVKNLARRKGKRFTIGAQDYFFMANAEFPWHKVPDIVVGRPAYDNFLVATAWRSEVSVVDATATLLALHQSGKDGDYSGSKYSKDLKHNFKVIGKFDYSKGLTTYAQFETVHGKTGGIELWHRKNKLRPVCLKLTL